MKPAGKGRWKLWHFAVLVLVAAPVFGAIRALARGPGGALDGVYFAVVLTLAALAPLALIRVGRKVAPRTTSALKEWGVREGGVAGFLAWLVGGGVAFVCYVATLIVAPIATLALLYWLAQFAGR